MSARAMGPTYAGGAQSVVRDGYSILYLPDINNQELIATGQSPVYYFVPNQVRMARKNGPESGDYLFNLIRFAGTGGDGVIGGAGETAGGVLTFSVTGDLPPKTRKQAESHITELVTSWDEAFWGAKAAMKPPVFRPAIVTSSTTAISNVAPTPRGFPVMLPEARGSSAGEIVYRGTLESRPRDSNESDSNLDPWYWKMEGQGTGSIDPSGTHAFSGLLGVYPTSICWAAFHGTASPLIVIQNYKLKVWSPLMSLKIHGSWDKIFTHFSKAAGAGVLWFSAGIKHEINEMVKKGDIEVEMIVDQTLPNSKQIAKQMQERSDLVFTKFMEQAQRVIFDPPMPQVEAAHASSGGGLFGLFGGGCALNYRRDTTRLSLSYEETSQFAYLQDHTISSSLAGMFDEMHADPEAERKYFQTVYLDDWPRRLARVVRPVVPWRDATVDFVSVQVGYPNTNGAINWEGHSFSDTDGNDGTWKFQTAQKALSDVSSPPASWKPDLTFVKRKVHLAEPPSEIEDPYRRVQIERNVIDLDSGPRGSLINDTTLEVRADSAGRLAVGPIQLGVMLTDASQVVEAVFEATDPDGEPLGLAPVRFRWNHSDVDTDRTWTIFTGDPDFRPFYRYQVSVTVKGTLFEPGRAWTGPWVSANGNGPLVIDIPRPGDDGVVTRSIPEARVAALRALTRGTAESHPVERNVAETTGVAEDKTVVRFRNYQV